ncbi:hypothetical protein U6A24_06260 [Aquimarina gracilis]|uniref:HTH domain-containing protein n=1 Tax=Aquimarina gracilis TaxID=874422 RepID=A0ABU5ZSP5_9FLAO|nr:hypothetical protein [Aquimarina gracilis]MEB3345054.1 hypothetical protein [Aquimarina gracilis]
MSIIIGHIEIIERIDQSIRLQATGWPDQLAVRLRISKTKVYRIINIMKELNAPVLYDMTLQSFIYETSVGFRFGFYVKDSHHSGVPSYA